MIQAWGQRVVEAQTMVTVQILGAAYARVAFGEERRRWDASVPCHDCNAAKGQLHVLGCDVEECPKCASHLVTCDCTNAEPADDDDDASERDDADP